MARGPLLAFLRGLCLLRGSGAAGTTGVAFLIACLFRFSALNLGWFFFASACDPVNAMMWFATVLFLARLRLAGGGAGG